ncbi:MAG: hypothetical protein LBL81_03895 [Tannerella sp.]|jgi:hypothetical protein|nr:hypothetical protein [Tannerella sp.]
METVIVTFDSENKAVKQVLRGLAQLGAISVKKSPYAEEFVKTVAQGDEDLRQGKGTIVDISKLWE